MRAFFTFTVFCSAFLLFVIEPIAAKMLLPTFGGSASVWTASMVFFQFALLAGYAYVNWLSGLNSRWMPWVHLAAFALAELLFDATLAHGRADLTRQTGTGIGSVALVLFELLGLTFVVLSATAPLLQRAFALSKDPLRSNPYFLYAASNAGSLVALLAYPIFIEPRFSLNSQFSVWAILARIALGLGFVALALVTLRPGAPAQARPEAVPNETATAEPTPTWTTRLTWLLLAGAASSLLLGVTTFLTTSVAPIPLLWVVPLALYLVTFIVAFAHKPRVSAAGVGRWVAVGATPLSLAMILESAQPIIPLAIFHLAVTFLAMLACHLRLSERRPGPSHLTEFYLWLAVGGAAGGLFNGVVAPHLFQTLFEYPLALSLCCALALVKKPSGGKPWETKDLVWPLGTALATAALLGMANAAHMEPSTWRTILTIGIPAVIAFTASGRPIRFGLSLLALFGVAAAGHVSAGGKVLYTGRSFYGVHRVVEDTKLKLRKLVHGNTVHGIQSLKPSERHEPLTYYSRMGPAGDVFHYFKQTHPLSNVGLVGLGVGSLAAYGEPGETMDFFEIDPVVIKVAKDPHLFTFLSDSAANVTVTEGDGRLTLAARPDHSYDLLVLDAFSSDAIPVHLLTEEALRLYLSKLRPHGLMLFHISNNYVDLGPILAAEARDLGLVARLNDDTITSDRELDEGKEPSRWMLLATDKKDLLPAGHYGAWEPVQPAKRGWTDQYSYLLGAMHLNGSD